MDALSGVVSVIAVVQATEQILSLLIKYYSEVKDAEPEINRLRNEIIGSQQVLRQVQELATDPHLATKLPSLKNLIDQQSSSEVTKQLGELVKILTPGKRGKFKDFLGRLRWPLKKEDVDKTLQSLERYKTTLNVALATDHA